MKVTKEILNKIFQENGLGYISRNEDNIKNKILLLGFPLSEFDRLVIEGFIFNLNLNTSQKHFSRTTKIQQNKIINMKNLIGKALNYFKESDNDSPQMKKHFEQNGIVTRCEAEDAAHNTRIYLQFSNGEEFPFRPYQLSALKALYAEGKNIRNLTKLQGEEFKQTEIALKSLISKKQKTTFFKKAIKDIKR